MAPGADGREPLDLLYRRYRDEIVRFVIREGSSADDAEDIVQTAFLDAHQAMRSGTEPLQPRPWLYAIARNARLRGFRTRSGRLPTVQLEDDLHGVESDVDARRDLVDAVDLLPANQRSVWLLREVGGQRYDEIASRLGLTVEAVQMLLFRARRKLRSHLGYRLLPLPAQHLVSWWGESAAALRVTPLGGLAGMLGVVVAGAALATGGAAGPRKAQPQPPPRHRPPSPARVQTPRSALPRRAAATIPVGPVARVPAVVSAPRVAPEPTGGTEERADPVTASPEPAAVSVERPAAAAPPATTPTTTSTAATAAAVSTPPVEDVPPLPVDLPSVPVPTTTVATLPVTLPQPPAVPPVPSLPLP